ncbi:MAG: type II secretion system F family protein [Rothia sp. (in: high G+C Gram-positive bacteria)]|nr:type II secretion system F family protein [Rothia sp. (in: high G+C Gram-positive bacteria)]
MSVLVGLLLGLGLNSLWLACWPKPVEQHKAGESKLVLLLRQADMRRVSPRLFYLFSFFSGLLLALLTLALTSLYNLSLLVLLVGFFLPRVLLGQRAHKRQAMIAGLWPDVVDHLRSGIRAGLSLPEALLQLQYRGPEQLQPAFEEFAADYRSTGDFLASLENLKARLADPVADDIVEALKLTRQVGGTDLGRLLGTLSDFLRDRARTRAELEARQSWTVNTAKLAVVAPWVVLCFMATQPGTVQVYNSFAGFMVMAGGLLVSVLAYRLMLRVGALPAQKRVLA